MADHGAHNGEMDAVLTRLVDALDDRGADLLDERLRAAVDDNATLGRREHLNVGLAVCSLALGVAATAVSSGGLTAVIVIWSIIGVVNLAYARWS